MRHHGGVASAACIHGYTPTTCLICQSLEPAKPSAPPARSGPRVVPEKAPGSSAPPTLKLLGVAVGVVVVLLVAWTLLHLVLAVLHILELVGVAVVAGYLGWVAGIHRGQRMSRRQ